MGKGALPSGFKHQQKDAINIQPTNTEHMPTRHILYTCEDTGNVTSSSNLTVSSSEKQRSNTSTHPRTRAQTAFRCSCEE